MGQHHPKIEREVMAGLLDEHVTHYLTLAPTKPRVEFMLGWLAICQWNARSDLYVHALRETQLACSQRENKRCSAFAAREELGRLLGLSERTLRTYIKKQKMPAPDAWTPALARRAIKTLLTAHGEKREGGD